MNNYKCIVAIMVTPHSGETDSLEVVAAPFLTSYMTKSLGTRLELICDGIMIPELKTLCRYYFHIDVIIQQKCFDILLQWSRCT